jgi:hypothetical protein
VEFNANHYAIKYLQYICYACSSEAIERAKKKPSTKNSNSRKFWFGWWFHSEGIVYQLHFKNGRDGLNIGMWMSSAGKEEGHDHLPM